jgi:hypothetical protein
MFGQNKIPGASCDVRCNWHIKRQGVWHLFRGLDIRFLEDGAVVFCTLQNRALSGLERGSLPRRPKGLDHSAWDFNPQRRQLNDRTFDGQMAFVPEGQHDRSQARSAWASGHRENRPVGYGMIGHTTGQFFWAGPVQALRAKLRSCRPSGTKAIRPSERMKCRIDVGNYQTRESE